jgi:hypothetical protein
MFFHEKHSRLELKRTKEKSQHPSNFEEKQQQILGMKIKLCPRHWYWLWKNKFEKSFLIGNKEEKPN